MADDAPAQSLRVSPELEAEFEAALRYHLADEALELSMLSRRDVETASATATVSLPSRADGLSSMPRVPVDLERKTATMFASHNEPSALREVACAEWSDAAMTHAGGDALTGGPPLFGLRTGGHPWASTRRSPSRSRTTTSPR